MSQPSAETEGLAEFDRFIEQARALPVGAVSAFRLDPAVALQNVRDAVASVSEAGEGTLAAELPRFDVSSLERAPALALAVAYASRRAASTAGRGTLALIAEATNARGKLLAAAEAFARAGLVPTGRVDKIRAGHGSIDAAQDCVDLAALFSEYAQAIRGKSPVSTPEVRRAAEVGAQLLEVLVPKAGAQAERTVIAEDVDRLGSLLVAAHGDLRRAAFWLYGEEAEQCAPRLGSRIAKRRKAPLRVARVAPPASSARAASTSTSVPASSMAAARSEPASGPQTAGASAAAPPARRETAPVKTEGRRKAASTGAVIAVAPIAVK